METKKITLRVPKKLWANFALQAKNVFINRAPVLNHILAIELPRVSEELGDFKMSPKARRYISGQLAKADAWPVNIEIQHDTALALDAVVKKHGLVRDALICRLILFLRGSDFLLNYLDVPRDTSKLWGGVMATATSPLKALEEIFADPLYFIRSHLNSFGTCGIYNCALPPAFGWAVCYIQDEAVPGTKSNVKLRNEQAQYAAMFDLLESEVFQSET